MSNERLNQQAIKVSSRIRRTNPVRVARAANAKAARTDNSVKCASEWLQRVRWSYFFVSQRSSAAFAMRLVIRRAIVFLSHLYGPEQTKVREKSFGQCDNRLTMTGTNVCHMVAALDASPCPPPSK